jgi:hypothetical protein
VAGGPHASTAVTHPVPPRAPALAGGAGTPTPLLVTYLTDVRDEPIIIFQVGWLG